MELPIYLIGYMASGKSTVGRILADRLGWPFVDLDEAFLEMNGFTTGEYIRQFGMEAFRKKEKACVEDLADMPIQKVIYATGGGYPCWEDNMDCLLELGTSFYLRWTPQQLSERLFLSGITQRPVAENGMKNAPGETDEERMLHFVTSHLAEREPIYSRAHYTVAATSGLDVHQDEELAEQILSIIKKQ